MKKKHILFGVDEVHIVKLTQDDSAGYAYDTTQGLVRLDGAQDLKVTEIANEYTLQGDNGTVDFRTMTEGFEIEIAYGGMSYEQLQIVKSGTIVEDTDSTTGEVLARKYITSDDDNGDYFGLIGVIKNSNSKIVLAKVKAVSVEIPYSNLAHAVVNVKARAVKRDNDGVMRIMKQESTEKAPAITDFDK